jgi:hypothetical protein
MTIEVPAHLPAVAALVTLVTVGVAAIAVCGVLSATFALVAHHLNPAADQDTDQAQA